MRHDPVSVMRPDRVPTLATFAGVALAVAIFSAAPAAAVILGPVSEPPGGVVDGEICYGDPCGEAIGRASGLTWTFDDLNFDFFTSLYYGPAGLEAMGFAMDGLIDDDGEWLGYAPGHALEDVSEGVFVFTGTTRYLYLCSYYRTVSTRLILDFEGSFLPAVSGASVGRPDLALLVPVTGPFSVTLRLQASSYSGGVYTPALDWFDGQNTCSTQGTRTDVTTAFFYEKDDHPAILEALAAIEAKLDVEDPRLDQILAAVNAIDLRTAAIDDRTLAMMELLGALLDVAEGTADDVGSLREMSDMMLRMVAEKALLEGKRVGMMYLPFDHGGVMEHVQGMVAEKIQQVEDSGESTNAARLYRDRGEMEFGLGRYKRAYDFYALAYCEAMKQLGERCPQ